MTDSEGGANRTLDEIITHVKAEAARHQLPLSAGGSRAHLRLCDALVLVEEIARLTQEQE